MNTLEVGTVITVAKSGAKNSTLQVGQRHVIAEIVGEGRYRTEERTGGWYVKYVDGVLYANGLPVTFHVHSIANNSVEGLDVRRVALMQELGCNYDDIQQWSDGNYQAEGSEYRVLTDSEADEALDEALESLLDDVILPELDEALQCYFDRDAWKRDATYDGRGHYLNHYDGTEEVQTVDGIDYFIYRID